MLIARRSRDHKQDSADSPNQLSRIIQHHPRLSSREQLADKYTIAVKENAGKTEKERSNEYFDQRYVLRSIVVGYPHSQF
jgi:hypothetical protein